MSNTYRKVYVEKVMDFHKLNTLTAITQTKELALTAPKYTCLVPM